MRRYVGGHTDGDALTTVDQQIGEPGRQNLRLTLTFVVIGAEIDGTAVDIRQQQHGGLAQPRLGITLGGRAIAIDAAEIALPIDQRQAQAEWLGKPNHGHIDRKVAVRMILAHHLTGDTRAFAVRFVRRVAALVHGIQDAAMDGLHPVARIRQGAADDDGHGIVKERPPHLGLEQHGLARGRQVRRQDGRKIGHGAFQR